MSDNFKISKFRIDVKVHLSNGESYDGHVHAKHDERLSDLMNDGRNFIPFTLDDGTVKVIGKTSVCEVTQVGEAKQADDAAQGPETGFDDGHMSVEEAKLILDIGFDFDRASIHDAHRKIMSKIHPDAGGSDYLASKVNIARDSLMKSLKK